MSNTLMAAAVAPALRGGEGAELAERIDPHAEEEYWGESYSSRPYVTRGSPYGLYSLAYRHGWESRARYAALDRAQAEPHLAQDWKGRGSSLPWSDAQPAVRDAWDRVSGRR